MNKIVLAICGSGLLFSGTSLLGAVVSNVGSRSFIYLLESFADGNLWIWFLIAAILMISGLVAMFFALKPDNKK